MLGLDLLGELDDDGEDLLAVGDVELPHPQVHRLLQPGLLAARRVIGRVPGLLDHRLAVVALDEHAVLVVDAEVHRPDHQVAAALAQPALRRREQRRQDLRVVLELQEAEHPPAVVLIGVEGVVDLRADAPDHAPVAPGAEQLRVAVLEEGVLAAAEEQPALQAQRGAPVRRGRVQPVRELDELASLLPAPDGPHVHGHGGAPYMPETSIDVFAKARDNERVALLHAAREADIVPYFRTVEGPARPWWRWRAPRGSCWAPTTTSA